MTSVAVIIPCYRDASTLAQALDSVRAQSRPADEIIVVNDASPETVQIEAVLRAYPEVRYLQNPENAGLAATRNNGLRASTCDVVSFLDADDQLHPDKLKLQLSVLETDPDGAVTCGVRLFAQRGATAPEALPTGRLPVAVFRRSSALLFRNRLTGAALMARRDLLLKYGPYDPVLRSCEDFDLWLRLLEHQVTVRKICLPLYGYYVNPQGLSKSYRNISSWELTVLGKHFAATGQGRPKRLFESLVYAVWLSKHLVRAARASDDVLRATTLQQADRLVRHRLLAKPFAALARSGFFSLLTRRSGA